jgi:hypothetical protein
VAIEALDELRKLLGVILFLIGQPSQAYGPAAREAIYRPI